jgi:hypothetical protein
LRQPASLQCTQDNAGRLLKRGHTNCATVNSCQLGIQAGTNTLTPTLYKTAPHINVTRQCIISRCAYVTHVPVFTNPCSATKRQVCKNPSPSGVDLCLASACSAAVTLAPCCIAALHRECSFMGPHLQLTAPHSWLHCH